MSIYTSYHNFKHLLSTNIRAAVSLDKLIHPVNVRRKEEHISNVMLTEISLNTSPKKEATNRATCITVVNYLRSTFSAFSCSLRTADFILIFSIHFARFVQLIQILIV